MSEEPGSLYQGSTSVFLDLVRVIACELVVIGHIFWFTDGQFLDTAIAKPPRLLFIAQLGVILFFFISGILISYSVLKKTAACTTYGFREFFIDRFSRIYSGLVPCLLVILAIDAVHLRIDPVHFITFFGNADSFTFWNLLGNLFMLQDVFFLPFSPFGDAFGLWTLNIEWWLYLSFGWIVLNLKKILALEWKTVLVALALSLWPVSLLVTDFSENLVVIWYLGVLITIILLHVRIPAWIRDNTGRIALLFLGLFLLRLFFILDGRGQVYDLTLELLIGIFLFCLILHSSGMTRLCTPQFRNSVRTVSAFSYTLYLVHFTMISFIFLVITPAHLPLAATAVLAFCITNLASYGIARYTEMRYRDLAAWLKRNMA